MPDERTNFIGYGFLSFLSVILWNPILTTLNTNLSNDTVSVALSSFFWIAYAIIVVYLLFLTITSLFRA